MGHLQLEVWPEGSAHFAMLKGLMINKRPKPGRDDSKHLSFLRKSTRAYGRGRCRPSDGFYSLSVRGHRVAR